MNFRNMSSSILWILCVYNTSLCILPCLTNFNHKSRSLTGKSASLFGKNHPQLRTAQALSCSGLYEWQWYNSATLCLQSLPCGSEPSTQNSLYDHSVLVCVRVSVCVCVWERGGGELMLLQVMAFRHRLDPVSNPSVITHASCVSPSKSNQIKTNQSAI